MNSIPVLAVLVLGAPTAEFAFAADAPRPNILFLYVDDMGWGSIGPNGQAARRARGLPSVQTPNIDRLASRGVNFSRGYGCHVCSPARSSLQSGFHQGHTFADRNDPDNAKKAMRADEVLIGDALSRAGYVAGYWGQWGYGGSKDRLRPEIVNVQTLPTSHGYEHVLAELHHVRAHTFFQPTLWSAPAGPEAVGGLELVPNSMARYRQDEDWPSTPARQDRPDYPATAYCDDANAFAALDFVRRRGRRYNETGQPFFGLLAVQIPHAPFGEITVLPDWDAAYAKDPHFGSLAKQTRQWAAMVTRIDAHFGNILAALEAQRGWRRLRLDRRRDARRLPVGQRRPRRSEQRGTRRQRRPAGQQGPNPGGRHPCPARDGLARENHVRLEAPGGNELRQGGRRLRSVADLL